MCIRDRTSGAGGLTATGSASLDFESDLVVWRGSFSAYGAVSYTHLDKSAIGCVKALQFLGFRVPEDISVAGFDDIELSRYFTPALTTVRNPIEEQGRAAVELMVEILDKKAEGRSRELKGILVPTNSKGICMLGGSAVYRNG